MFLVLYCIRSSSATSIYTGHVRVFDIWNKPLKTFIWRTNKPMTGIAGGSRDSGFAKSSSVILFRPYITTRSMSHTSQALGLVTQWNAVTTCRLVMRVPPQWHCRPPSSKIVHRRTALRGRENSFEKSFLTRLTSLENRKLGSTQKWTQRKWKGWVQGRIKFEAGYFGESGDSGESGDLGESGDSVQKIWHFAALMGNCLKKG